MKHAGDSASPCVPARKILRGNARDYYQICVSLAPKHNAPMSSKEIVRDLLQRLPENASLHDIAREIEFVAAVRQGLDEVQRGGRIPIEEIEGELPSWVIK